MDLLVSLLIYIVVFALVYYCVVSIMVFLEADPRLLKIGKAVMMGIFLILILALVFGPTPGYLPRWHWNRP
jgi:Na+-transporting methylmalonyl-CoA/oxaloacetate decarboxylase beta subunit